MQFQMPRFLDIEDKVIGPLTFKQFIYLFGGLGFSYISIKYLGWTFGLPFALIFGGLGIGLSFWKPNNRPAVTMLQAFLRHYTKSRMYVWQRPTKLERMKTVDKKEEVTRDIKTLDRSKIEALAWSLDVLDRERNNK